jgi:signal transduction histidine kinase
MLATALLAIRCVHVVQGLTCLASGRRAYRSPRLATVVEIAAAAELATLAHRVRRRGGYDSTSARVDAALGLAGLAVLSSAMERADRTNSLNWMLPLTVGSSLGSATLESVAEGALISSALGGTYAVTTLDSIRRGGGPAATAVANALSYPGFFAVATLVVRIARKMASEVDKARLEAVEQGARLAAEAARNREHRLLHDSALQTLEALASGTVTDPDDVRRHAAHEAVVLRRALSGDAGAPSGLVARLSSLAAEFDGRGLRVELVTDELEREPPAGAADALCEASREALANVLKHAGVSRSVVRLAETHGGWRVTVRDRGAGFVPETTTRGFGLDHSVGERLREAGGSSNVRSSPSEGTRVELWIPA